MGNLIKSPPPYNEFSRTYMLSRIDIDDRFWSWEPIKEQIATLSEDVYYFQYNDSFEFVFSTIIDYELFRIWFLDQELDGRWEKIIVPKASYISKIIDWLNENDIDYRSRTELFDTSSGLEFWCFFRTDEDRINFLLRWK